MKRLVEFRPLDRIAVTILVQPENFLLNAIADLVLTARRLTVSSRYQRMAGTY